MRINKSLPEPRSPRGAPQRHWAGLLALSAGLLAASPAAAQGPTVELPDDVADTDDPITRMQTPGAMQGMNGGVANSDAAPAVFTPTSTGVGSGRRAAIGGYGEADLMLGKDGAGMDTADAQWRRFVIFLGNQFNDWLAVYTELEIEGAHQAELEQAYIEAKPKSWMGLRVGLLLMPTSIVNKYHEPPTFYTAVRPLTDRLIVPTTWRELGIGIFGTVAEGLNYELLLTNGLDGSKFSPDTSIRGGRGKGQETKVESPAVTGRVNYNGLLGLDVGASIYFGGAKQDNPALDGVRVTMAEADARYARKGFEARAQFAQFWVSNSDKVTNLLLAADPMAGAMGKRGHGFYVNAGYDVLRLVAPGSGQQVHIFGAYETVNTVAAVSSRTPAFQGRDALHFAHVGVNYRPHWQVALKFDVQLPLGDGVDVAGPAVSNPVYGFALGFMF